MDLRQLAHVVAVAEERHFSRAAARLHIVQSGLSSSIKSLEAELGAALFIRSTRQVELSEAGRAFLPEARAALAAAERARAAVSAVTGLLRGTLSVGVMQVLDPIDLPALLRSFRDAHPHIELRLRQGAAATLVGDVRGARLDLAFVGARAQDLAGLEAQKVGDAPIGVVLPRGHRLAGRRALTLGDLADEPFVEFPTTWGLRGIADEAFAASGIQRAIAFEIDHVATVLDLVAAGLGTALTPPWRAVTGRDDLVFVPLRGGRLRWQLNLVKPAPGAMSPAAQAFAALATAPAAPAPHARA